MPTVSYHDVSIAKVVKGQRLERKPSKDRSRYGRFHFKRTLSMRSTIKSRNNGWLVQTSLNVRTQGKWVSPVTRDLP